MNRIASIKTVHILHATFFGSLAIMPLASLFWEDSILSLKVNWMVYPIFIIGVMMFIAIRTRINQQLIVFLIIGAFYMTIFQIRGGDMESFGRISISVVPFLFLRFFNDQGSRPINTFFVFYFIFLLPSFYLAYLQYTGRFPYYEFDYVDGQMVGRLSGGYSKPMNFIAFLTPIYILGLYMVLVLKRRLLGAALSGSIISLLFIIGHRTSLIAFLLIGASLFFKKPVYVFIFNYYKYFFNFAVGILSFIFFYFLKIHAGLIDAMRGRIAMWEGHAQEFFQSDIFTVIFGKQKVQLPEYYAGNPLVVRLDEVHNNTYRTILLFGIVGYFIYCVFVRWLVLSSLRLQVNPEKRFIILACFTYFILYSITNEPFYYGSVVWPILIWIFFLRNDSEAAQI